MMVQDMSRVGSRIRALSCKCEYIEGYECVRVGFGSSWIHLEASVLSSPFCTFACMRHEL